MQYSSRQQREVFHLLFLSRLLKISDAHLYVLQGGVNLRFFFRSPRYSEDMDLDVRAGSAQTLKKNGYKVIESGAFRRSLETYGISDLTVNDPAKAKHTDTTQRFRLTIHTEAGESLPTKVEFSRRTSEDRFIKANINPDVVHPYHQLSFACQHYTRESAVRQKLLALAHRSVVQARDVFDLYILYLGGNISSTTVRLDHSERNLAIEQLLSLDYADYTGQVLEYLEPADVDRFGNETVWSDMHSYVFTLLDQSP